MVGQADFSSPPDRLYCKVQETFVNSAIVQKKIIKVLGWEHFYFHIIAPDKAAYCVFTQFHGPENAIKFISVGTKTQ